jgi:hypothetical protein
MKQTKPVKKLKPLTPAERRIAIKAGMWPLKRAKKPAKIKRHMAAPATVDEVFKALKIAKKRRRAIEKIVDDVTRTAAKQTVKNWKKLVSDRRVPGLEPFVLLSTKQKAAREHRAVVKHKKPAKTKTSRASSKRSVEQVKLVAAQRALAAEWDRKGATIRSLAKTAYKHGLEAHVKLTPVALAHSKAGWTQVPVPDHKPKKIGHVRVTLGDAIHLMEYLRYVYDMPSEFDDRNLIVARDMEKLGFLKQDAPNTFSPTARGRAWREYMKGM